MASDESKTQPWMGADSPFKPGPKATKVLGSRQLFVRKNPGAPGKLGKSSTKAESLAKLRGKGALA